MEKTKILYIHHGGSQGGAPRSLRFLIDRLDPEQYDSTVVACSDQNGNRKLFEGHCGRFLYKRYMGPWHGSTVCPVSLKVFFWNLIYYFPTVYYTKKLIRELQPDIVHLNSTCLCMAAKAIKKVNPDIPVICHVREPLLEGFWGNILRKKCNRYVDQFVAIEEYDAQSLHTDKPVEVIHNFVDFGVYNETIQSDCLRTELGLGEKETVLLYLARIAPSNGALEAAAALKELLQRRPDIHLCIVGATGSTSDYEERLRAAASGLPNLHILPFRSDVPNVIASSDVMLVPFQTPHFARSVIEAGAMGVPSIASDIGGLQELIVDGKTGLKFDYRSFEGFADLCERLSDDKAYRAYLGENALKMAHERFDADKNAERTFALYNKYLK